jgi:hypothetical protein
MEMSQSLGTALSPMPITVPPSSKMATSIALWKPHAPIGEIADIWSDMPPLKLTDIDIFDCRHDGWQGSAGENAFAQQGERILPVDGRDAASQVQLGRTLELWELKPELPKPLHRSSTPTLIGIALPAAMKTAT